MESEKECADVGVFKIPTLIEDLGYIFPTENSKQKARFGIYECPFCGTQFKAHTQSIKNGDTKSCGCYRKSQVSKRNTTHGEAKTKIYKVWRAMLDRTLNTKDRAYTNYGGRGITLCDEWKQFVPFRDWALSNGYSDELSIDRINNNGNYTPDNCRWTTKTMQNRNQRVYLSNTSGFKGVHFAKNRGKFLASITVDKKRIHLGYFHTATEGGVAYNNYIIENNLEGFILNIIPTKTSQP